MAGLRVLQVHFIDKANSFHGGGGVIAMYRLHRALLDKGVDAKILCRRKTIRTSESVRLPAPRLEYRLGRVTQRLGLNDIHCVSSFRVTSLPEYRRADVIHFQGIHGGFFSYLALPKLTRDKPGVFTMHDSWAFTGHCALPYDCERWKAGCGACPYPEAYPPVKRDATHLEWRLKKWAYGRSNLTIAAISNQQVEQARQSILGRFPVERIPNGIDVEAYSPLDPEECRRLLGIPEGKRVLLFVSLALQHFHKGGDLLAKALQGLPEPVKRNTVLLLLGEGGAQLAAAVGMEALTLGYISSSRVKRIVYSAADLLVHPSRSETQPLVMLEGMACGTPMVAFRVGGVPDLVRPGVTGYLARREDPDDLRRGVMELLDSRDTLRAMGETCRRVAVEEFSMELHVQRYIDLYTRLLDGRDVAPPRAS